MRKIRAIESLGKMTVAVGASAGGTPAFSDNFARADGDLGNGWDYDAGTWAVVSGAAVGTPTLGAEKVTDSSLEATYTAGKCATLSSGGTPTLAQSADAHTGSKAQQMTGAAANDRVYKTVATVNGSWHQTVVWGKRSAGAAGGVKARIDAGGANWKDLGVLDQAAWTQYLNTFRATVASTPYQLAIELNASSHDTVIVDDYSLKALTLTSQFCTRDYKKGNVTMEAALTGAAKTQFGFVLALDSTTNPQNYILIYHDGTNITVDKCAGGTYSNVQAATAAAYGAGRHLKVNYFNGTLQVFYNNVQVGADLTVNDAGLMGNTRHGLFTTYSGNSFDDFQLAVSGSI